MFEEIEKIEKKRQQLISELSGLKEMARGSFCTIHVKCGKKYCRCQNGQLHPHKRMSLRENGKSFSRAVPKEEHEWITAMTDNYRRFQKLCKEIDALGRATKSLLDSYEAHIVNQTRKGKSYLSVTLDQKMDKKLGSKK
jgi:hypothetical protein